MRHFATCVVGCVRRLLVKQYVPEIMKAVVALPEQQVCGAIGLCSSSSMSGERFCAAAMHPVLFERYHALCKQAVLNSSGFLQSIGPGWARMLDSAALSCHATPFSGNRNPWIGLPVVSICWVICWCCAERPAASRRLLLDQEAGALGDPNPVCQFCEVAVSYVKVRLQKF